MFGLGGESSIVVFPTKAKPAAPTITVQQPEQIYPALPYPVTGVVVTWTTNASPTQGKYRLTLECKDADGADCASQLKIVDKATTTYESTLDQINLLFAQSNIMLHPPVKKPDNTLLRAITSAEGKAPLFNYTITVRVQNLTDQSTVDPPGRLTMRQKSDGNIVTNTPGVSTGLIVLAALMVVFGGVVVFHHWRRRQRQRQHQEQEPERERERVPK